MRKLSASSLLLLLLSPLLLPASARAQYSTAATPTWYDYGVMRQQTLNGWSVRDRMRRRGQQQQRRPAQRTTNPSRPGGGGPSSPPTTAAGDTTFRPVAPTLLPQRLAANTPAHRAEAVRFYSDLLDAYHSMARQKGVPANDVARAASYAILSLQYVNGGGQNLSPELMDAVRAQMRELFAGDDQFQRLDARGRQELYESYIIQGMAVSSIYDGATRKGDRRKAEEMRAAARESLRELLGVPAERISFTPNGVEFR